MYNFVDTSFLSSDGKHNIHLRKIEPKGSVKFTFQIAHGIAEHGGRYEGFARFLADSGGAVYINDHLGHGKSIAEGENPGYFADVDGWMKVVDDMRTVYKTACEEYPFVPHVIFGHSMGSFLVRTYLYTYPQDGDAAIICGTAQMPDLTVKLGRIIATVSAKNHPEKTDLFLNNIAFGTYNKAFKPSRTQFDWLTRRADVVDEYIKDPMCGFVCTSRLYADMMEGLGMIANEDNLEKMDKNKPILFISGGMDPVGENGKGVQRAFKMFNKAGMQKVKLNIYPYARHELLNETNYQEVYGDILGFVESVIVDQSCHNDNTFTENSCNPKKNG